MTSFVVARAREADAETREGENTPNEPNPSSHFLARSQVKSVAIVPFGPARGDPEWPGTARERPSQPPRGREMTRREPRRR